MQGDIGSHVLLDSDRYLGTCSNLLQLEVLYHEKGKELGQQPESNIAGGEELERRHNTPRKDHRHHFLLLPLLRRHLPRPPVLVL